ncbi:MAG: hypothetical protein K0R82_2677 [Flavipsychrobacter sp.]|jgi:hypothetical protein|nr:hypothetical protein [Flavipsychrobacter sp.]
MKKNMNTADSVIRLAVALAILVLYLTGVISGTTAIVLIVLAVVFIFTAFIGFCPLYLPFGISTRKKNEA